MQINDLKENRKFQVIVCIILGFLMFFYQMHLEKEHNQMLNEIEEEIEKSEDDLKHLLNQLKSI